jgi:hypothetical protein
MLDLREIDDVAALVRLDELNKKVADSALRRPYDPDASMFIDFTEHVQSYACTDRQPVTLRR